MLTLKMMSAPQMMAKRSAVYALHARSAAAVVLPFDALSPSASVRAFSSSPGGLKDKEDGPKKELTPFQKLQKWMQPFVHGSKELFQENKQAWQIRSRLKGSGGKAQLTRQEMMVLRQAHRDLLKSLPLLVFFAIPLVGYAAPLVGYQFPKQLLPWQFWRPDQKTAFLRQDAEAKAAFYPELVKLLIQIDNKDKVLKELLAGKDGKEGMNPAQVGELAPFFDQEGPAHLSKLSTKHVHALTRSVTLFPAFSALTQFVPKSFLQQHLEKRTDELRVDDLMLLKEGIDSLSLSELEFACEERGILGGYGDIEALRSALSEWLTMYDPETAAAQQLPSSLLLHAPSLVRFSDKKTL